MKKANRFIALLLAVLMLMQTASFAASITPAKAEQFKDFPEDWSKPAVTAAVNNGLLEGYEDSTIRPKNNITRAEMAAIITRAFGATVPMDISILEDVKPDDWFYDTVKLSYQMRAFNGTSTTTFAPKDYITRQDMFLSLARVLVIDDGNLQNLKDFADGASVSSWASAAMSGLIRDGYVDGYEDKTLRPKNNITRAEVAQVFYNSIDTYISKPGIYLQEDLVGTVLVRSPGVIIRNATIDGDLIVADGVGNGNFEMEAVHVKGRILFRGGEGKVTFKKVTADGPVIIKDVNGTVNFNNYRSDTPFQNNTIEYTKATFLEAAPPAGGGGFGGNGGGPITPPAPETVTVIVNKWDSSTGSFVPTPVEVNKNTTLTDSLEKGNLENPTGIFGWNNTGWVDESGDEVDGTDKMDSDITVTPKYEPADGQHNYKSEYFLENVADTNYDNTVIPALTGIGYLKQTIKADELLAASEHASKVVGFTRLTVEQEPASVLEGTIEVTNVAPNVLNLKSYYVRNRHNVYVYGTAQPVIENVKYGASVDPTTFPAPSNFNPATHNLFWALSTAPNDIINFQIFTMPDENVTFKPVILEKSKSFYSIEYWLDNGDGSPLVYHSSVSPTRKDIIGNNVSVTQADKDKVIEGYDYDEASSTLTGTVVDGTLPAGPLVLKLVYKIKSYTVSFLNDDGTPFNSFTVKYNQHIEAGDVQNIPEVAGQTQWIGWSTVQNDETKIVSDLTADPVKSDLTFYPIFKYYYVFNYNLQKLDSSYDIDAAATRDGYEFANKVVTRPAYTIPEGFELSTTKPNVTQITISKTLSENVVNTYYDRKLYTVTFEGNFDDVPGIDVKQLTDKVMYGANIIGAALSEIPTPVYNTNTHKHYWILKADQGSQNPTTVTFGDGTGAFTMPDGDVTFVPYIVEKTKAKYYVKFMLDDDDPMTPDTQYGPTEERFGIIGNVVSVTQQDKEKDIAGYEYDESLSTLSGVVTDDQGANPQILELIVVYKIKSYTVSFLNDDGTPFNSFTVKYNQHIEAGDVQNIPDVAGQTQWAGWSTVLDDETKIVSDLTADPVTGDLTFYPIFKYYYVFNYNLQKLDSSYDVDAAATRDGYEFANKVVTRPAYTIPEGFELSTTKPNVTQITISKTLSENVVDTYYDRIVYTVTFYKEDKVTVDTTENVMYGGKLDTNKDKTLTTTVLGKHFAGWTTTVNDVTTLVAELANMEVKSTVALYPIFKFDYTITYYEENADTEGYTEITSIKVDTSDFEGVTITPEVNHKDGVEGFVLNTEASDEGDHVLNSKLELVIKYDRVRHTVAFYDGNSAFIKNVTVKHGARITDAPVEGVDIPEIIGVDPFRGWATTGLLADRLDLGTYTVTSGTDAEPLKLYAIYDNTNLDFNVIFYVEGTQYGATQYIKADEYATAPTDPVHPTDPANFVFKHWALEGDATQTKVDIATYPIVKNTKFVAVFDELFATVEFYKLKAGSYQLVEDATLTDYHYGDVLPEAEFPAKRASWLGYVKDSGNALYKGVYAQTYQHEVPTLWLYLDAQGKWQEFVPGVSTIPGTAAGGEVLRLYNKYKSVLLIAGGDVAGNTIPETELPVYYETSTRVADSLKDMIFANEVAIKLAFDQSGVQDKLLEKLAEKQLLGAGTREILNVNRFVKFSDLLGERLNPFLDEQLEKNFNMTNEELLDRFGENIIKNKTTIDKLLNIENEDQFGAIQNTAYDAFEDIVINSSAEQLEDIPNFNTIYPQLVETIYDTQFDFVYDYLTSDSNKDKFPSYLDMYLGKTPDDTKKKFVYGAAKEAISKDPTLIGTMYEDFKTIILDSVNTDLRESLYDTLVYDGEVTGNEVLIGSLYDSLIGNIASNPTLTEKIYDSIKNNETILSNPDIMSEFYDQATGIIASDPNLAKTIYEKVAGTILANPTLMGQLYDSYASQLYEANKSTIYDLYKDKIYEKHKGTIYDTYKNELYDTYSETIYEKYSNEMYDSKKMYIYNTYKNEIYDRYKLTIFDEYVYPTLSVPEKSYFDNLRSEGTLEAELAKEDVRDELISKLESEEKVNELLDAKKPDILAQYKLQIIEQAKTEILGDVNKKIEILALIEPKKDEILAKYKPQILNNSSIDAQIQTMITTDSTIKNDILTSEDPDIVSLRNKLVNDPVIIAMVTDPDTGLMGDILAKDDVKNTVIGNTEIIKSVLADEGVRNSIVSSGIMADILIDDELTPNAAIKKVVVGNQTLIGEIIDSQRDLILNTDPETGLIDDILANGDIEDYIIGSPTIIMTLLNDPNIEAKVLEETNFNKIIGMVKKPENVALISGILQENTVKAAIQGNESIRTNVLYDDNLKKQILDDGDLKEKVVTDNAKIREMLFGATYRKFIVDYFVDTYLADENNLNKILKDYGDDFLNSNPDAVEQIKTEYRAQVDAALVLLKEELANEEEFTVAKDTEIIVIALEAYIKTFTFEQLKTDYLSKLPEAVLEQIPLDIFEPVFTRTRDTFYNQVADALAKCDEGVYGEDNKVPTGVTLQFNPVSEIYIPLYDFMMDKYEKMGDELANRNEAFYDKYQEYYEANPYNDVIVELSKPENFLDGSPNPYTDVSSGYSLKSIDDIYELIKAASVLVDDSFVWYCENVDMNDVENVIDKFEEKILHYLNFVVGLVNDYAANGIPSSLKELVDDIMIDDMIKNDIAAVDDKITAADIDAYIESLVDNAIANRVYDGLEDRFGVRLLIILEKFVDSRFNKTYDHESIEKGKEVLNKIHAENNGQITTDYIFDRVFKTDSKSIEAKGFEISIERTTK